MSFLTQTFIYLFFQSTCLGYLSLNLTYVQVFHHMSLCDMLLAIPPTLELLHIEINVENFARLD